VAGTWRSRIDDIVVAWRNTGIASPTNNSLPQHHSHSRHWRENAYVYPVISRRSGGLSIGINLAPDAACNFSCVYCQVDRRAARRVSGVDIHVLRAELARMIDDAASEAIFEDPVLANVPAELRRIKDIAFSGDGEPTASPYFPRCVQIAADLKRRAGLDAAKIVLITNACYLTRPEVVEGLAIMDENNGEVWAKLDAATEEYHRLVNRPSHTLEHVMHNIIATARVRPIVIQALFMRLHGVPPDETELEAFVDRLNEILHAGGRISRVQVYTVARRPAENFVSALTSEELDRIASLVRKGSGLPATPYYGSK
jgi:wyosine [tRNA(Phe)-imidazoG37] synthetase (radical SAM superfamily)